MRYRANNKWFQNSKMNINTEEHFFQVLSSPDVWNELKLFMYPGHNKSNLYDYKNGDVACFNGYLSIIKTNKKLSFTPVAIVNACKSGHLKIVKWLHEHTHLMFTTEAMDEASKYGHIDIVKFLHFNRNEGCTSLALENAIRYRPDSSIKHIEVAKFLIENGNHDEDKALYFAARFKNTPLFNWLERRRDGN